MPRLFSFGKYVIYFWVNEGMPTEPIHVHISEGRPTPDGTKIWLTQRGKTLVCHNMSKIPRHTLSQLCRFVEANVEVIESRWMQEFGELRHYC